MKNTEHPKERKLTIDEAVAWLKDGNAIENDNCNDDLLNSILKQSVANPDDMIEAEADMSFYELDGDGWIAYDEFFEYGGSTIKLSQIESTQSNTVEREEEKPTLQLLIYTALFKVKFEKEDFNLMEMAKAISDSFYPLESIQRKDVEEAAERYANQFVIEAHPTAKSDFLWGAQWQHQQSESRIKELEEALIQCRGAFSHHAATLYEQQMFKVVDRVLSATTD